ncbi:alcohol dehydrogenase catalytic domain-containing protein [Inquilinus sp. OTU3971]|uniref:alcohol dehydrogenase catalytic domain-containing protein n=1 Tax=Inquilinus sp. OTU3971 TaxID=3043855 RepID=UPI00313A876C
MVKTTICGTDLHILKGDVATCAPGRILGHRIDGTQAEYVRTPMLLRTVQSGKIDPARLITHRFPFDRILDAYDTFGRAADTRALKVISAM